MGELDKLIHRGQAADVEWRIPLYRHEGRKEFGELVAGLRTAALNSTGSSSWTQKDLARASGVSQTYIGMIERGERTPSLDVVISIIGCFGRLWDTADPDRRLAPPTAVNEGRSVYFEFSPPGEFGFFDLRRVPVRVDVKPDETSYIKHSRSQAPLDSRDERAEQDRWRRPPEDLLKLGVIVDAMTRYPEILNTFYPEILERVMKADADIGNRAELEDQWANDGWG